MVRRMANPEFRQSQLDEIYAPHVAPLNRYVDELGAKPDETKPPYIAPMYFGVAGHALGVFRDPGPKAGGEKGSGFICVENDDATAERMMLFCERAALDVREVTPWNAYPWYINAKPTTTQLASGLSPLLHVAELMPELKVIVFFGGSAQHAGDCWNVSARASSVAMASRRCRPITRVSRRYGPRTPTNGTDAKNTCSKRCSGPPIS